MSPRSTPDPNRNAAISAGDRGSERRAPLHCTDRPMIWHAFALLVSAHAPLEPPRLTQRQLDAISARCGTPRKWLRRRDGELHIRPPVNARYEAVDCVLAELKRRQVPPMGFVGNEGYDPKPRSLLSAPPEFP
jgi:hypothetical protein